MLWVHFLGEGKNKQTNLFTNIQFVHKQTNWRPKSWEIFAKQVCPEEKLNKEEKNIETLEGDFQTLNWRFWQDASTHAQHHHLLAVDTVGGAVRRSVLPKSSFQGLKITLHSVSLLLSYNHKGGIEKRVCISNTD